MVETQGRRVHVENDVCGSRLEILESRIIID
jgi:hypothetical protein